MNPGFSYLTHPIIMLLHGVFPMMPTIRLSRMYRFTGSGKPIVDRSNKSVTVSGSASDDVVIKITTGAPEG